MRKKIIYHKFCEVYRENIYFCPEFDYVAPMGIPLMKILDLSAGNRAISYASSVRDSSLGNSGCKQSTRRT